MDKLTRIIKKHFDVSNGIGHIEGNEPVVGDTAENYSGGVFSNFPYRGIAAAAMLPTAAFVLPNIADAGEQAVEKTIEQSAKTYAGAVHGYLESLTPEQVSELIRKPNPEGWGTGAADTWGVSSGDISHILETIELPPDFNAEHKTTLADFTKSVLGAYTSEIIGDVVGEAWTRGWNEGKRTYKVNVIPTAVVYRNSEGELQPGLRLEFRYGAFRYGVEGSMVIPNTAETDSERVTGTPTPGLFGDNYTPITDTERRAGGVEARAWVGKEGKVKGILVYIELAAGNDPEFVQHRDYSRVTDADGNLLLDAEGTPVGEGRTEQNPYGEAGVFLRGRFGPVNGRIGGFVNVNNSSDGIGVNAIPSGTLEADYRRVHSELYGRYKPGNNSDTRLGFRVGFRF